MSLVNQMLQDLEHRRTAGASISPLGGLNSSGIHLHPLLSGNQVFQGITLILSCSLVFVVIYLFILNKPATTSSQEIVSTNEVHPAKQNSVTQKQQPTIVSSSTVLKNNIAKNETVKNKYSNKDISLPT